MNSLSRGDNEGSSIGLLKISNFEVFIRDPGFVSGTDMVFRL